MSGDCSMLPESMQADARAYIEQGRPVGDFMRAVLANDLVEAFGRADLTNRAMMFEWVSWLYNEVPAPAWRSAEAVDAWIKQGGQEGYRRG